MPRDSANPTWSDQRERQYEHIKEGLLDRGEDEETAEEIAARTVNKERARNGEAEEPSRSSIEDISSGGVEASGLTPGRVVVPTVSCMPKRSAAASTAARR